MTTFVMRSEAVHDGVQPFDPRRHMRQVADLLGVVFADEFDARGRSAVAEMRLAGAFGPVLGGMLSLALFEGVVAGYVWLEGGSVVGNVTLQRIDAAGSRWRISNVAVAPEQRGRGIARSLMLAGLRAIAARGGDWAVLQVRTGNEIACRLYKSLGFADACRDGFWRLAAPAAPPLAVDAAVPLERLHAPAGDALLDLARSARPPLAQWAEPIRASDYSLGLDRMLLEAVGRLTRVHRVERWAAWAENLLIGAVETRTTPLIRDSSLRFAVRPLARGRLELALVDQGLRTLARSGGGRPVVAEHSSDHAEGVAALETCGFHLERELITMRRAIKAGDARL